MCDRNRLQPPKIVIIAVLGVMDQHIGISGKFNMRMRSENIALQNLEDVTYFCHENDLKAYLTTNILVYDNELEEVRGIIRNGKDAIGKRSL